MGLKSPPGQSGATQSRSGGNAAPWNPASISPGSHTIAAEVEFLDRPGAINRAFDDLHER